MRRALYVSVVCAVVLIAIGFFIARLHDRPVFANHKGRGFLGIYPTWHGGLADNYDIQGNFVLLDYEFNIVLVVLVGNEDKFSRLGDAIQWSWPLVQQVRQTASRDKVLVKTGKDDSVSVKIESRSNVLIIVTPDGCVFRAPLVKQRGRRVAVPPADFEEHILHVVEKHYADQEFAALRLIRAVRSHLAGDRNRDRGVWNGDRAKKPGKEDANEMSR